MTHLSDEAVVDLADGGIAGREHLAVCAACRDRVESVRQLASILRRDEIPEPSPLFWDHFSRRINDQILEQTPHPGLGLLPQVGERVGRWRWRILSVTAAAGIIFILAIARTHDSSTGPNRAAGARIQTSSATASEADGASWAVTNSDEPWQLVEGAAADLDLDSAVAAGIFMRDGSLDRELLMLSDQERGELARSIQAELNRSQS